MEPDSHLTGGGSLAGYVDGEPVAVVDGGIGSPRAEGAQVCGFGVGLVPGQGFGSIQRSVSAAASSLSAPLPSAASMAISGIPGTWGAAPGAHTGVVWFPLGYNRMA